MTRPRQPRPRDAIERRILDLEAAKTRHANLTRMARLEREVAALPDPRAPTPNELARRASEAQLDKLLNDWSNPRGPERGD
ncbi:hypothetical protein [Caulobacter sp. BK020]|uniref:hypothetical protein n=1 Tax=Caulobacter sp. BK020 TaxID=2512117 RepID=UPI001044E29D|nr:hypothetical protein [Caulobacter sp. BK020]TCS14597.1 hypothetical protein EV278_107246 [Caulobacter sp. BK020]